MYSWHLSLGQPHADSFTYFEFVISTFPSIYPMGPLPPSSPTRRNKRFVFAHFPYYGTNARITTNRKRDLSLYGRSTNPNKIRLLYLNIGLQHITSVPTHSRRPNRPRSLLPTIPTIGTRRRVTTRNRMRLNLQMDPNRRFRHRRHVITPTRHNLLRLPTTSARHQSDPLHFRYARTHTRLRPNTTKNNNKLLRKKGPHERRRRPIQTRPNDNNTRVVRITIIKQIGNTTMRRRPRFDEST